MTKEVHAAHILCKTEKKALEVKELLASGQESFAQMARKYSQCPSGRVAETWAGLARAGWSRSLKRPPSKGEGKIIGPVKSQFGYHLIPGPGQEIY